MELAEIQPPSDNFNDWPTRTSSIYSNTKDATSHSTSRINHPMFASLSSLINFLFRLYKTQSFIDLD